MSTKNMIANRYEVIEHIGQGGMADVFLAVDTILNRHVAVKILRADLSDAVSILRFEREAQAATALSHPNIVEIYDVGDYKGHHYIVMEYVPGKTLKTIIKERGPLMNEETVDIMKQLTSAIAEAHKRGIIHRDIKPQNIIVKSDNTIKILDFGIATAKGSSLQLTQANNVMGSVHYLAPELAKGDPASVQSDIYAMGIVMYECVTGTVPFKSDQAVQIALMHMRDKLPDIRSKNPDVPQSMINVILHAAAKNPEERYRTADDMLNDIATCLSPERASETPYLTAPLKDSKKYENKQSFSAERPHVEDTDDDNEDEDYTDEWFTHSNRSPKKKKDAEKERKKVKKVLLTLLVILLLGIAVFFGLYATGVFGPGFGNATVPDLRNDTTAQAESLCTENGLTFVYDAADTILTTNVEAGRIVSTEPQAGEQVKKGTEVKAIVSAGIGSYAKDYTGYMVKTAVGDLAQYPNITVETQAVDDTGKSYGSVVRQENLPAGELFSNTDSITVTLYYASYPTITIPWDIIGMKVSDASAILESQGVKVLMQNLDGSDLSEEELQDLVGRVSRCDPAAGTSFSLEDNGQVILYYY